MNKNLKGRPLSGLDNQCRSRLIEAARIKFSVQGYAATTTRDIAKMANVNSAMIRYYFGHKAGLFETVLRETVNPVSTLMNTFTSTPGINNMAEIVRQYHKTMSKSPELPILVFSALHNPLSAEYEIVRRVFDGVMRHSIGRVLNQVSDQAKSEDVNLKASVVCVMALALFPFLLPQPVREALNFECDVEQLEAIANRASQLFAT